MITLQPTESELNLAGTVGVLRMIYAVRTGRKRLPGIYEDEAGPIQHVLGAIAELTLARHLDVFWSGTIGTINAVADVGGCYQVRATDRRNGKLITHKKDNNDQPFVLAYVLLPDVHLVGWLWGSEAKFPGFWREDVPHPAYFAWPVHEIETLPDRATVRARQRLAATG
jgi:hypothetical protein